jgi:hypothetical protein
VLLIEAGGGVLQTYYNIFWARKNGQGDIKLEWSKQRLNNAVQLEFFYIPLSYHNHW